MLFGKRIKELRESQKLPQRVVADALEITIPLYSRVERGERTLSKSHLPKLAQVLNVEENELLKLYLADQVALVLDGQTEIYNDVLDIAKKDITNMTKHKPTVLDLFCGCGGISSGFEQSGYKIIGGIDFNDKATETFAYNFKEAKVLCTDITTVTDEQITEYYKGVDVIVGGPPCQGFSSANRWQKELEDPRNKLFFEYLRFVKVLKPKVVMIENVRGLLTRDNGYAKERITTLLSEMGYYVNMTVLDASDYGVPQNRKRAIFVAIRTDLATELFDFESLVKLPKVTVGEAISELYAFETSKDKKIATPKATNEYLEYLHDGSTHITDHEVKYPAEIVQKRISFVPQGGNWASVPEELWPNNRKNRHSSAYKRLNPNDQSCTIDTGNAHSNYFHPIYNRIPTVRESARLQSFKDSFHFVGARGSQYRQVGNAVPPLLAKAVADQIKKIIKK